MTTYVIEKLRNVIRGHNRSHKREFRFTFQVVDDFVHLSPVEGTIIYYGELLCNFCSEYELEMFIEGTTKRSVIVKLV